MNYAFELSRTIWQKLLMQITTFSDYCLRILIFLAVCDGRRVSAREIAEHYGISIHHIAKAGKWLAKHGHVVATKGKGGGLTLARKPEDIKIGVVIRQAEENTGLVECMRENGHCAIHGACGLAPILSAAQTAFFEALDHYSIADATAKKQGIAQLLKITHELTDRH